MVRISVLYPMSAEGRFDHDYYVRRHLPLVRDRFGPFGLLGVEADRGVADGTGDAPGFIAAGHLIFDSVQAFQRAFEQHGQEIMSDLPNFTQIQPHIQISEILA